MYVIKRDGRKESVHFDKITARITKLSWGLAPSIIDPVEISKKVIAGVYSGVRTSELDILAAETCASLVTVHPDYAILAARIEVSNLHKNTKKVFSDVIDDLYKYINPQTNELGPLIADDVYEIVMKNKDIFNSSIVYDRDYSYDYFGIKTLMRSYLLKLNGEIVERPQHMLMRVSVGIHKSSENIIEDVIETYNLMSEKWFTHATPTLFNSGTRRPQMSSCFLLTMKEDSIEGIYDTLKQCALISKNAGGIGVAIHCIRSAGSYIRGTNGESNGIIPMLRVFNNTARYVDQGGGKRKGSFAMYLEPWHADIFEFLDLRKNTGNEEERARDLFLGLWIPDLFMKRVEKNGVWSLMCPNECKGLFNVYGDEFEQLYCSYEQQNKYKRQVKARDLWSSILQAQIETGTPYMCYKDAINRKSNQKNLGIIKSSNLCTEIVEYTDVDEVAVCNLASLALPMFVVDIIDTENGSGEYGSNVQKMFDFKKLMEITKVVTKNLNKIIDGNFYPVKEAYTSNMRHRPIGIGVQGLADVFLKLRIAFDSPQARKLNSEIFECIYFAACQTSMELAMKEGPYKTYQGSPASQGLLQYDLWFHEKQQMAGKKTSSVLSPTSDELNSELKTNDIPESHAVLCGRFDWITLKAKIAEHGMRNSLLVAPMPTASTSQILGNNECFEPYTSNVYIRRTLAGEFICINNHLLRDLISLGIWNPLLKNKLIANNGSVQSLKEIPEELKVLYKTVWELSQKTLIDMAADRGMFVDQSQSFNIHMTGANYGKLTSMHFYGWKKGLKTGMYYLRTKAAVDAIQFTVDKAAIEADEQRNAVESAFGKNAMPAGKKSTVSTVGSVKPIVCMMKKTGKGFIAGDEDECLMCGS